jgi:signal transduction histidine kinase
VATHAALAIDNARLYERAQGAYPRARGNVLSFVAHDLRQSVMGILLTTETLLNAVHARSAARGGSSWNASGAACSRCGT